MFLPPFEMVEVDVEGKGFGILKNWTPSKAEARDFPIEKSLLEPTCAVQRNHHHEHSPIHHAAAFFAGNHRTG